MRFQLEPATIAFFDEALPLFVAHHNNIPTFEGEKLSLDFQSYLNLQDSGALRVYTARDEGELIGYQVLVLNRHLHYDKLAASQLSLFISPERRGFGHSFLKWCNTMLATEGVDAVFQHVTKHCNFSKILIRDGYEFEEVVYKKNLKGVA